MLNKIKLYKAIFLNTIILLILLELILNSIYSYKSKKEYDDYIDLKIEANVHPTMSAKEIKSMYYEYNELEMQWSSYTHYIPKSFQGKYNNVNTNGIRKTTSFSQNNTIKPIKIFCFGGSTMYGIGSDDEHTIPSLLSKTLSKVFPNKSFEITNFGVLGYNRNQESFQLQKELLKGNIPDIVIFYDGVNEVLSSFQNENSIELTNATNRYLEFNTAVKYPKRIQLFLKTSSIYRFVKYLKKRLANNKKGEVKDYITKSNEILINYKTSFEISNSLSNQFNFKVFNFLQPTIYSKNTLTKYEEIMAENDSYLKELYLNSYNKLSKDIELKLKLCLQIFVIHKKQEIS